MAENKENNRVTKFKPLVATAVKVNEEGKEIGDKEMLKIQVPIEEDAKVLKSHVDVDNKNKNNTEHKEGVKHMDEEKVESILQDKLAEMEFNKKINGISKHAEMIKQKNDELEKKLDKQNEKIEKLSSLIEDQTSKLVSKQEESCTGVECIKASMEKFKQENEALKHTIENIQENTKMAMCSGEKGCNGKIPIGSSFCPNCGKPITSWKRLPGWKPYGKR